MNTYSIDEILKFIIDNCGSPDDEVTPECDIIYNLGVCGDDLGELLCEYSQKFNVDMSSYLWYFHTEEEGHRHSIGSVFFKAPNDRVNHIPVTPSLLLESANEHKWVIKYPEHKIPKRRYDIFINILFIFLLFFFAFKCH